MKQTISLNESDLNGLILEAIKESDVKKEFRLWNMLNKAYESIEKYADYCYNMYRKTNNHYYSNKCLDYGDVAVYLKKAIELCEKIR